MPVDSRPTLQDIGTLRGFIRSISQGIYVVTPAGEILDANPALVEIFGAGSLEELQQYRSADLVPSKEQRAERLRLLQSQGWLRDFEYQIRRIDGAMRTVRDTVFAQRDDQGEIVVMHGIITDVTDEDTPHGLSWGDTPWGAFFAGAPAGLAILDESLRFVRVNERLSQLHRLPVDDHVGRPYAEVVPGLAPAVGPILRSVLETGEPALDFEVPTSEETTPSEVRYWRFSAFPVGPLHGAPTTVGVIVVDVTTARRIEQEVRFDQRYLLAMIENHPLAIVVLDAGNRVLSVNQAFENMFLYTRAEVLGKDIDVIVAPPQELAKARELTIRTRAGERMHVQGRRLRKDGTSVEVGIYTIPIALDGELVGAYGMYEDLTARRLST
jgi:PAS domain S-box-containing protein